MIVSSLALLQAFGFTILNVKPNLALAAVIASAFFIASIWEGLFLILLAGLILKFGPIADSSILLFEAIAFASVFSIRYLPWQAVFNNIFLILAGTGIFYFVLARDLLLSFGFFKELGLNITIGALLFALLKNLWENKE